MHPARKPKPFGPAIIRCLECEGKTVMDGIVKIMTGHGERDTIRCVCVDCKVVWGIYNVDLPNQQVKGYQKRLTPKMK